MPQILTRRSLVAAAPAAVVAASLPATASCNHFDAELLALREPWRAALADFNGALDLKCEAQRQIIARTEAYPDFKTWTGNSAEFYEACARITDKRTAIEGEAGLAEATRLEDATADAEVAIVDHVTEIPARTLAGLAFKVEVSEEWTHGREELIDSIMADIKALAKGGLHA